MKRFSLCLIAILFAHILSANELVGRVLDVNGTAVSFASVYLREDPIRGTMTDDEGFFILEIDPVADKKMHLVCSFVGYNTYEKLISKIPQNDTLVVVLVEQPIELDAAEVNKKISKRESRKLKKIVLQRFRDQLNRDFPYQRTQYGVVSTYEYYECDTLLIKHQMVGSITEWPKRQKGHSNRDSLSMKVESVAEYKPQKTEEGYEKLNDIFAQRLNDNKKNRKREMVYNRRSLEQSEKDMHLFLWGTTMYRLSRLLLFDKLNMWDYTVVGGQNVLTYTDSRNYVGIVKGTLQIHFYVDPATMSVQKVVQSLNGTMNIPFGYKLKGDELEFLNMIQNSNDTIEKYRVKRLDLDMTRNVFIEDNDGVKSVKEKNIEGLMSMTSTKKARLNFKIKSKIIITSTKHFKKKK